MQVVTDRSVVVLGWKAILKFEEAGSDTYEDERDLIHTAYRGDELGRSERLAAHVHTLWLRVLHQRLGGVAAFLQDFDDMQALRARGEAMWAAGELPEPFWQGALEGFEIRHRRLHKRLRNHQVFKGAECPPVSSSPRA